MSAQISSPEERVATLTLDCPPLNILDLATMNSLIDQVDELARRDDLHLVVVRGAGEKAFCAGMAVEDHLPGKIDVALPTFHRLVRALRGLSAVTLAAVRGHCLGGGLELASACDLVVASERSRFGVPEIKLGCYPPVAAALYPRLLGRHRAMDLIITGRTISATEAMGFGLVGRVVPDDELDQVVTQLEEEIGALSAPVVRMAKRAVELGEALAFDDALTEVEKLYLEELAKTHDMTEGMTAFIERREPQWRHR